MSNNEISYDKMCSALSENTFECTLEEGHDGPHKAEGIDREVVRTWEND